MRAAVAGHSVAPSRAAATPSTVRPHVTHTSGRGQRREAAHAVSAVVGGLLGTQTYVVALMAFQDWFRQSKLTAVRMEQPVYDKGNQYAGTIDISAAMPPAVSTRRPRPDLGISV